MKRFQLHRDVDETGISGTGIVAEGVMFTNGAVVLSWLTQYTSIGVYENVERVLDIHGHCGKTRLVMVD